MKETRILFTPEMFLAGLERRKAMTRRVVVPQPPVSGRGVQKVMMCDGKYHYFVGGYDIGPSPYGEAGDILLPCTTWTTLPEHNHLRPLDLPDDAPIWMPPFQTPDWRGKKRAGRFLPKKFWEKLPRWPLADVYVELLQAMTFKDWIADFVPTLEEQRQARETFTGAAYQREHSKSLWDKINGPRGYTWDSNPVVFVYKFKPAGWEEMGE